MFLFFFRAQILIGCSKSMYKSLSLCLLKRQQVTNSTAESKLLVREPLLLWVRIPFFIFVGKKHHILYVNAKFLLAKLPLLWLNLRSLGAKSAFHGLNSRIFTDVDPRSMGETPSLHGVRLDSGSNPPFLPGSFWVKRRESR